ncbi:MAG: hypothetical protein KJ676_04560 [Alphaproteobacteria bacterium]|nr:hypothetical protein [Alphaproteobacteria bacterium]MBU1527114.1 hypothetical protein [Alphaproteobacteria bacterium]MBU2116070.1 hypothetical protein [Alphaproteobacteria bacterium]MBU2350690.1 hypothetical protein [Alphaproteobacteria bacterium]MBU2383307.1 hypothetical protein [Alphaproteobacteria bacterium]
MNAVHLCASLSLLLVSGCATKPWPDLPLGVERITFEHYNPAAYCGDCDGTTIIAAADGTIWIEERYWERPTSAERRMLAVDPQHYRDFEAALAPYRPTVTIGTEGPQTVVCDPHSLDVRVTWWDGEREVSRVFLPGCSNEAAIGAAVLAAPLTLQIDHPGLTSRPASDRRVVHRR